ncbi:MAG: hypothetical protein ACMUJM_16265 [bacterium]
MNTHYTFLPKHAFLFFYIIIIFILSYSYAYSAEVTLAWDRNSEPDLAGYKVYYKTDASGEPYDGGDAAQGTSGIEVPVGDLDDPYNPTYQLTGLSNEEIYYFAVTAYDQEANESDYSNEVCLNPFSDNDSDSTDTDTPTESESPSADAGLDQTLSKESSDEKSQNEYTQLIGGCFLSIAFE